MPIRKQLAESLKKKIRTPEFWIHGSIYCLLGLALWPITTWFAITAHAQSRVLHALIVLVLATLALIRFGNFHLTDTLSLNDSSRRTLVAAYAFLFIGFILRLFATQAGHQYPYLASGLSLLQIPAYCLTIASFAFFVFGNQVRRIVLTVGFTFCIFMLLSILMQPLDWPLRGLAGKWSQNLLVLLGQETAINLVRGEDNIPLLILMVNGHPFHVASECNGFGVILTCILISVMLGLYRRLNVFNIAINIVAGMMMGFLFNTLRIVIIILLAPHMMEHYMLMHEVIGGITYWGCLISTWLLLNGPVRQELQH